MHTPDPPRTHDLLDAVRIPLPGDCPLVSLPRGDAGGCPQSQVSENGLCTNSDTHAQGASLAAGGATLTRPGHRPDPYASPQAVGALARSATYPSDVVTGTFQKGPL